MTERQSEILGYYEDQSPKRIDAINKSEQQSAANAYADAVAKQNREEREQKVKDEIEKNFKLSERQKFLEASPNATPEDFERLYPQLRQEALLINYKRKLQTDVPAWENDLN